MKRLAVALFLFLGTLPFWGQEVVVFEDHRSLVVQSHRIQGEWTYLRIGSGEMAVLSKSVLEIRQEPAGSAAASPSPSFGSPQPSPGLAPRPGLPQRPGPNPGGFRNLGAPTPPPAEEDEGEEDDEEADDEEEDMEEPPPPDRTQAPAFPQRAPPVQPKSAQPGLAPLIVPGSGPPTDR